MNLERLAASGEMSDRGPEPDDVRNQSIGTGTWIFSLELLHVAFTAVHHLFLSVPGLSRRNCRIVRPFPRREGRERKYPGYETLPITVTHDFSILHNQFTIRLLWENQLCSSPLQRIRRRQQERRHDGQ